MLERTGTPEQVAAKGQGRDEYAFADILTLGQSRFAERCVSALPHVMPRTSWCDR
jgi:hypothetical protein